MTGFPEKDEFLRKLRERGGRVTPERLALLDEVFAQHGHIDADELLRGLKRRGHKISRATVYRNLDLLVELGMVSRQQLGSRRYLYEHVHAGQRHDHLVCAECGRVVEFLSPGISALQNEIARAHGFVPGRHTLQIHGVCVTCAAGDADGETETRRPAGNAGAT
jgi:Fur family transcriptional regulator, ferric uptake regulator